MSLHAHSRSSLLILLLLLLGGCSATEDNREGVSDEAVRPLVSALRDYLYTIYDLEEARQAGRDVRTYESRLRNARDDLLREMKNRGLRTSDDLSRLVPALRDFFVRRTDNLLLIPFGSSQGAGVRLVRIAERKTGLERRCAGRTVRYNRIRYDEILIRDGATYLRPEFGRLTQVDGRTILLDAASTRKLGEDRFFGRLHHYRTLASRVGSEGVEALLGPTDAEAYRRIKDHLRWKSLEETTTEAEFVDRMLAEEEAHAVWVIAADEKAERTDIHRRAYLGRIVHAHPHGGLATTIGVALAARKAVSPVPEQMAAVEALSDLLTVARRGAAAFPTLGSLPEDPKEALPLLLARLSLAPEATVRELARRALARR